MDYVRNLQNSTNSIYNATFSFNDRCIDYSFCALSPNSGFLNNILDFLGFNVKGIYETKFWPLILVIVNAWKHVGYSAVVYLAAISGISKNTMKRYTDGANKSSKHGI